MEVVPLFDVPHLFKCLRNNLLGKDIQYQKNKFATWDHIITAYKIDMFAGNNIRHLPKLTDKHVYPQLIKKMNVSLCTQVFSRTVANRIKDLSGASKKSTDDGPLGIPKDGINTSFIVEFFNKLFDALNGKEEVDKSSPFRTVLTDDSFHLQFFNEALAILSDIKFVNKQTKKVLTQPPCLNNLKKTIQGIKVLWKNLKQFGFTCLKTRHLNQDPLENFFSQIRGLSANRKPSCFQFISIFKSLIFKTFNNYKPSTSNCENDNGNTLVSLESMCSENVNYSRPHVYLQKIVNPASYNEDAIPEKGNLSSDSNNLLNCLKEKVPSLVSCNNCSSRIKTSLNSFNIKELHNDTKSILRRIIPTIFSSVGICNNAATTIKKEITVEHICCPIHKNEVMEQFINLSTTLYLRSVSSFLDCLLRGKISFNLEKYPRANMFVMRAISKYDSSLKNKYVTFSTISKKC